VATGAHDSGPELGLVVAPLLRARNRRAADEAGDDRERHGEQQVGPAPDEGEKAGDPEGLRGDPLPRGRREEE
jgi:hypothetical protein